MAFGGASLHCNRKVLEGDVALIRHLRGGKRPYSVQGNIVDTDPNGGVEMGSNTFGWGERTESGGDGQRNLLLISTF